jgi:hypothetical protein
MQHPCQHVTASLPPTRMRILSLLAHVSPPGRPSSRRRSVEYESFRLVFYSLVWAVIIGESVAYALIYRRVRGMARRMEAGSAAAAAARARQRRVHRFLRSLLLYPLVLICCWGMASVNRLYQLLHDGADPFGLMLAQTVTLRLQGLLNAVV